MRRAVRTAALVLAAIAASGAAGETIAPREIEGAIGRGDVPFVQPLPDGTFRVSFVWKGETTSTVELDWPVWTPDRKTNRLERIPGSDLWVKSVVLPRGTRLSYSLAPDVGVSPHEDRAAYRAALRKAVQPDPLNPHRWNIGGGERAMSVLELPGAIGDDWALPDAAVPAGEVETHQLHSSIFSNDREVALYLPAGDVAPEYLLILFDGDRYRREIPTPVILDNMIAAGVLPPAAAVFVSNPSPAARGEELACNPAFTRFLADELLPWVEGRVAVPVQPQRRILGGASYGGLASACAALDRPDLFGAVLSQSGSFWWQPAPDGERWTGASQVNWVRSEVERRPAADIRFYVEAGALETQADAEGIRDTSRDLHATLANKGYDTVYSEPPGGHDWYNWRATLPAGLLFLTRARAE